MTIGARRRAILQLLESQQQLTLEEAMARFSVSPATARRDFAHLHAKGLVLRKRSHIRRLNIVAGAETPLGIRETQREKEKNAIMREAGRLLKPNDVVFMDVGSTLLHWLDHLPPFAVRVITNFIPLSMALAERQSEMPWLEISVLGGTLYPQSFYTYGPATIRHMASFNADWAFISPDGVDADGFSEVNEFVAENQRTMIRNSARTALVASGNKFGKRSPVRVQDFDDRFTLVTDPSERNEAFLAAAEKRGARVIRALPS